MAPHSPPQPLQPGVVACSSAESGQEPSHSPQPGSDSVVCSCGCFRLCGAGVGVELQLSHPLQPGVVGLLYSSGAHEPSHELHPESSGSFSAVVSLCCCWFAGVGGWVFSAPHSLFGQPESLPEHDDG